MDYPSYYELARSNKVGGKASCGSLRRLLKRLKKETNNGAVAIRMEVTNYSGETCSYISVWDGHEHAYFERLVEAEAWIDEYIRRKKDASR